MARPRERDRTGLRPRRAGPPASVEEALARARDHGRGAAAEALAAVHALLDAAALATSGQASQAHRLLGPLARLLERLAADLDRSRGEPSEALLTSVAEALDAEIARWEKRAQDDADARAVLRAFLGLREVLWEFGVRQGRPSDSGTERPRQRRASGPRPARRRVQRVPVEG